MIKTITNQKILPNQVKKIIKSYQSGRSINNLAKDYNVEYSTIYYHLKKNKVIIHKNKKKYTFRYKETDLPIISSEIKKHGINLDSNMTRIVNVFFLNLFLNIEKPLRILSRDTREKKEKWYNSILEWTKEDNFWFDMYEEYLMYDSGHLKKVIRNKVKEKIKNL